LFFCFVSSLYSILRLFVLFSFIALSFYPLLLVHYQTIIIMSCVLLIASIHRIRHFVNTKGQNHWTWLSNMNTFHSTHC
jgi:hypothetical protein